MIDVLFDNKKKIKKEIKALYKDRRGKITIPYLGEKKVFDNGLEPNKKRVFELSLPQRGRG